MIAVPGAKFSCRSWSAWGSAWVGPSSPVARPAWPQIRTSGPPGAPVARVAGLVADGVQPGGDVPERRHEGAVRRADAERVTVGADARQHAGDGVFADAAHRQQPRLGIGGRVPEARREVGADLVDARRAGEIGRRDEHGATGGRADQAQRAAEGLAERRGRPRREPQLVGRVGRRPRRELVDGGDARRAGARPAAAPLEPLARRASGAEPARRSPPARSPGAGARAAARPRSTLHGPRRRPARRSAGRPPRRSAGPAAAR